ncbi:MAG: DNA polymerase I [Vicinamibacteraceae bacterium]
MAASRLFLIDGSNQMYRAYHALPPMTNASGQVTHAVYGFVTMLLKLIADHKPEFIAASFDLAGPTFRRDLAADYKATRSPMPSDLIDQVPLVHQACRALGVPILTTDRYEADDVMGTLARQAVARGFDVALVTGDKDFFQLVGGPIKVYNPREPGTWFDAEGVTQKFGVPPEQVIDVLALMGDTSDNVKGVPGIGEKGARDLITQFGSLESLIAGAATVTQKRYREALQAHADDARQSQALVTIHTDCPVTFDPEACRYTGAIRADAFKLFSDLAFRSLVPQYAPTAEAVERDYEVVEPGAIDALVAACRAAGSFAMHVVTDDASPMRATLVGLSISTKACQARYVPLAHTHGTADAPATAPASQGGLFDEPEADVPAGPARANMPPALKALLEDGSVKKVGHALKQAAVVLAEHGVTLHGLDIDTELASYLLDANRSEPELDAIALELLTYRACALESVVGKGAKAISPGAVAPATLLTWAGERADLAAQVAPIVDQQMQAAELTTIYETLEKPLIPVLVALERAGVRIDGKVLAGQAARLEAELDERAERIYGLAGERFNINSPKQLGDVLFVKLQLPALKRTGAAKTPSTAQDVLEELALTHDLPREVIDWRGLQKLKGTYLDALPTLIHPTTGRVHTQFSQTTAATGRLSSRDPNLQNVPIRTELGREIRRGFVAEPGWRLISADYSQIELRVLAHLSGDPNLSEAFRLNEDIHDRTALQVFGENSGLSAHELRRRAKIINYALLYGKTAFTLSRDIGVTTEAAKDFIAAYFAGFPAVRAYLDGTIAEAKAKGFVSTLYGRRRAVPDILSRNGMLRSGAERIAVNMPIQGTAADILKRAMIDLHGALAPIRDRARMILTVHDELLIEAHADAVDDVAALVKEHMEHAAALSVPLTVDVGIGENWKDAKA